MLWKSTLPTRILPMAMPYLRKNWLDLRSCSESRRIRNVDIHVDASALEVWDVNAGEYVVEGGTYQLYAAHSSDLNGKNVLNKKVKVTGSALSTADATEN